MRTAIIVSVTSERQLELPPDFQAQLQPGDEYLVWTTEDSITFKKVCKPERFAELMAKVEAASPDPEEVSLDELSAIVREVRQDS